MSSSKWGKWVVPFFFIAAVGCGGIDPEAPLSERQQAMTGKCACDADCAAGTVCEKTYEGTMCVTGCHEDWQCGGYRNTYCNLKYGCMADGSCPGQCFFLE